MKHINIPIFIPHLGCPNQCIFCNQRYISGKTQFDESIVEKTINEVLTSISDDTECEIAFFGGSFTGIDRDLMIRLLDTAQRYVEAKRVVGIRMSTRPDYISQEIIDILKKYTVTFVELGIQSMNDSVLTYLKRGHTSLDTINAAKLLKSNGISFIGQMMVGLPTATLEDELYCAQKICELGALGSRIYPTLVFRNTELEELTISNEYSPLSLEEAVKRSAFVLDVFVKNNVECIRIGLCDSDNLHSSDTFVAGPNSPSIGEMVKSSMLYQKIDDWAKALQKTKGCSLVIECGKGLTSQVIGHKKCNIENLRKTYCFSSIRVLENNSLDGYKLNFILKEENDAIKIT